MKLHVVIDTQGAGRVLGVFSSADVAREICAIYPNYYKRTQRRLNRVNVSARPKNENRSVGTAKVGLFQLVGAVGSIATIQILFMSMIGRSWRPSLNDIDEVAANESTADESSADESSADESSADESSADESSAAAGVTLYTVIDTRGDGRVLGVFDRRRAAKDVCSIDPRYYKLTQCRLNKLRKEALGWTRDDGHRTRLYAVVSRLASQEY